jgi:hypothetical protein
MIPYGFIRGEYITQFVRAIALPALRPQGDPTSIDHISIFFIEKMTKHLEAICLLCKAEFGEDALIISRAMLEHGIYLAYIANADTMTERLARADSFVWDGDNDRKIQTAKLAGLKEKGLCLDWISDLETTSEPFAPVANKPGNYQPLPNLARMSDSLGGTWQCLYYFIYWSVSKLVHPNGLGSHTYMGFVDPREDFNRAVSLAFPVHIYALKIALGLAGRDDLMAETENKSIKFLNLVDPHREAAM